MKQAFSDNIVNWYKKNKRDLPWRNTKDPYLIWLSEIILQQTRVDQGMSYYLNFIKEFPTVIQLANASEEKVLKLWQGLGYYSRARNLHYSAKIISTQWHGKFPNNYNNILTLKGVGEYTAAAIASFAFNQPHAVVDGNVFRVLSRVFGIKTPIDSGKGKKEFTELANSLIDKRDPAIYNQAIMEFGAMYCKPQNPDCTGCCLNKLCYAFEKNRVSELPLKSKKTKQRNRYFNYLVINYKKTICLKQREESDIWKGLYEFPLIETEKQSTEEEFLKSKELKTIIGKRKFTIKSTSTVYKHILSHQKIYARFWEIDIDTPLISKKIIEVRINNLEKYPIPKLIDNYLSTRKKWLSDMVTK